MKLELNTAEATIIVKALVRRSVEIGVGSAGEGGEILALIEKVVEGERTRTIAIPARKPD